MGAEHGSRVSQVALNPFCGRMRTAKHAPSDPFRFLERRQGLAEIVQSCAVGFVERFGVTTPHPERGVITFSENASRHGHRFEKQGPGFSEAL